MIRKALVLILLAGLGLAFAGLLAGYAPDEALNRTAQYYAAATAPETGAQNIVTAIVVTYRGLDTLGEVTVLFLTAAVVAMTLSQRGGQGGTPGAGLLPAGELLQTGSRILVPLIGLFGAYVFLNGHLTPGGGFQGGAILASGVLLLFLADPSRRIGHRAVGLVESGSGLFYVTIGVLGMVLAGGFLDSRLLPAGSFGTLLSAGAIPLIYTLIGLKVGAEFSSILGSLRETEDQ